MCVGAVPDSGWHLTGIPRLQALTAGFFFNAAKLQRSGNYRTIKNKQTVHMHPQNGLSEVRQEATASASVPRCCDDCSFMQHAAHTSADLLMHLLLANYHLQQCIAK